MGKLVTLVALDDLIWLLLLRRIESSPVLLGLRLICSERTSVLVFVLGLAVLFVNSPAHVSQILGGGDELGLLLDATVHARRIDLIHLGGIRRVRHH